MTNNIENYIQNLKCFCLFLEYENIGAGFDPTHPVSFTYPFEADIVQKIDDLFFRYPKQRGWSIYVDRSGSHLEKAVNPPVISDELAYQVASYYASIYDPQYYCSSFYPEDLEEMEQSQYLRFSYLNYPSYEFQVDYGQFRMVDDDPEEITEFKQTEYSLLWNDSYIDGYEWVDGSLKLYVVPCYLYGKNWLDGMYGRMLVDEKRVRQDRYWLIIEFKDIVQPTVFPSDFIRQELLAPITIKQQNEVLTVLYGSNYYLPIVSKDVVIDLDSEPFETVFSNRTYGDSERVIHKIAPNSRRVIK